MYTLLYLFYIAAIIGFSRAGADGWHLDYAYTLGTERLDPIVSPNSIASHMHRIIGGSKFGASYDYDEYNSATCSSLAPQADKSNYWMPELYWRDNTTAPTEYIPLRAGIRFYYFATRAAPNVPVTAFPKGLRMLTGDPNNKSPPSYASFGCRVTSSTTISGPNFNFATSCPNGLVTELFFPPCWDGQNLWKDDMSHMAFPTTGPVQEGPCPISHPVRLPVILLEYTWFTYEASNLPLAGNLVWASGDTTGYGIHGDFVNGWDVDVLQAALNSTECGIGSGAVRPMQECPILAASWDINAATSCRLEKGLMQEPQGNIDLVPVTSLPGCNAPWGTQPVKPACDTPAPMLDVAPFTGVNGNLTTGQPSLGIVYPSTPGWTWIACLDSLQLSMVNSTGYTDSKMTVDGCTSSCLKGDMHYAAIGQRGNGGAWTCLCANTVDFPTTQISPGACTLPCPGNSSQICGGSYNYNFYYASDSTVSTAASVYTPAGALYLGCLNTASPSMATYTYTSASMTIKTCNAACTARNATWAGTSNANKCMCGDASPTSGSSGYVPDYMCNWACSGNKTQNCGGNYQTSIYNLKEASYAPVVADHVVGYKGCYASSIGGISLSGLSWSGNGMTQQICVAGCNELGYTLAGLQSGNSCYCGNSFSGGQALPASSCMAPCAADRNSTCGGTGSLDLYSTTGYDQLALLASNRPSGYMGCFVDSSTASPLNDYLYTSIALTIEICIEACRSFKYAYAGLEAGNTCKCGNTAPTSPPAVTNVNCVQRCVGNQTETCGGSKYLEAYQITTSITSPNVTTNNTIVVNAAPANTAAAYIGCYKNVPSGLTGYTITNKLLTNDMCRSGCLQLGYSKAATSGTTCQCGNSWVGGSVLPASSCSTSCAGNTGQSCGGVSIASVYSVAGIAPPPRGPNYVGCYATHSAPALNASVYGSTTMTTALCTASCSMQGYRYAGLTSGTQCYCGASISSTSTMEFWNTCSTACAGNSSEMCGGMYYVDIFDTSLSGGSSSSNSTSGAISSPVAPSAASTLCYQSDSSLNGASYQSDWMSPAICSAWCFGHNSLYSGVRAGNTCLCGNKSPTQLLGSSVCNSTCTADPTKSCGTSNGVVVTKLSDANLPSNGYFMTADSTGLLGCYSQGSGSPMVLPYSAYYSGSMTIASCASNCQGLQYAYSGIKNGNQCFCARDLNITSNGFQVPTTKCSTGCSGAPTTKCGAAGYFSVFDVNQVLDGVAPVTSEGHMGCYQPSTYISSAGFTYSIAGMTPDLCRQTCRVKGYSSAGLYASTYCGCGTNAKLGVQQVAGACSSTCSGNADVTCGGSATSGVDVYDTSGAGSLVSTSGFPSGYVGCFTDTTTHVLSSYAFGNSGMTNSLCSKTCAGLGYGVSGTSNGNQCYCGTDLPSTGLAPVTACSQSCAGVASQRCGSGLRLSTYMTGLTAAINQTSAASPLSTSPRTPATTATAITTHGTVTASIITLSTTSLTKSTVPATASGLTFSGSVGSLVTTKQSSATTPASSVTTKTSNVPSSSTLIVTYVGTDSGASTVTVGVPLSTTDSSTLSATTTKISQTQSTGSSQSNSNLTAAMTIAITTSQLSARPTVVASSSIAIGSKPFTSTATGLNNGNLADMPIQSQSLSTSTTQAAPSASAIAASVAPGQLVGCYSSPNVTIFDQAKMTCSTLAPPMCNVWCNANGYAYAALSNGDTCGCGNSLFTASNALSLSCDKPCFGDSSRTCGSTAGAGMYSVYRSSSTVKRELSGPADAALIIDQGNQEASGVMVWHARPRSSRRRRHDLPHRH